jgi:hypothetical protein
MSIKSDQIYRHYKGKLAMVLGAAEPRDEAELLYMQLAAIATSTEDDAFLVIKRSTEGDLYFRSTEQHCETVIVYQCSGRIWFRSPKHFEDSFTEVVFFGELSK